MAKVVDRDLRKELLLKSLDTFADLDKAFEAAIRMERFILEGIGPTNSQDPMSSEDVAGKDLLQTSAANQANEVEAHGGRRSSSRNRWREDDEARLRELYHQGHSVNEIAAELKRTPASVYGRIHQFGMGLKARSRDHSRTTPSAEVELEAALSKYENLTLSDQRSSGGHLQGSTPPSEDEKSVAISEVVHFLRTRDYSVTSAGDGRFQVDGRQIMTAQELLQRANRVRESMGRSPWSALHAIPIVDKSEPGRDTPKLQRNGPSKGHQ